MANTAAGGAGITSQSYQGSSIAVSGGKVLLNSTDNTPFPAPSQTNLYVLALR